jgi:hypothetical protein
MSERVCQSSPSAEQPPRPVWIQLSIGLLMGFVVLGALSILFRQMF